MAVNQLGDGSTDGVSVAGVGDKVTFFGGSPVAQQTNPGNTSTGAAGGTNTVFLNTTFTGGITGKAYTIGDIVAAMKQYNLIAS